MAATATDLPRLQQRYRESIAQQLMSEFQYSNVMEIPRITKVAVNIGLGEALENANAVEAATKDLMAITGQRLKQSAPDEGVMRFPY